MDQMLFLSAADMNGYCLNFCTEFFDQIQDFQEVPRDKSDVWSLWSKLFSLKVCIYLWFCTVSVLFFALLLT